jgi:spore germination protein KC
MKKIIILIILSFFLTGCYDYHEINKISLVTAIGIDYIDDNYIVTLEVMNQKVEKDSAKINSYTKTGSGKTIGIALEDAASKIANEPNYSHTSLMVLSASVAESKFQGIIDFFLRNTYFRENFYVITSLNDSPQQVLNTTSEENPIASSTITEMLDSNKYSTNTTIKKTFEEIIKEILTYGKDTCFTNIAINDNEFKIDGAVLFNDYALKGTITNNEAMIYNLFQKNTYRPSFTKQYSDKYFAISVTKSNPGLTIKNGKLIINGDITGEIMQNESNFDIRDLETLKMLNDDFEYLIMNNILSFLEKIQQLNSDILGIDNMVYLNSRKKIDNYWLNLDFEINITFEINKKGLIYEVSNEE